MKLTSKIGRELNEGLTKIQLRKTFHNTNTTISLHNTMRFNDLSTVSYGEKNNFMLIALQDSHKILYS